MDEERVKVKGRPPKSVVKRIQEKVDVKFTRYLGKEFPAVLRDQHWTWGNPTPKVRRQFFRKERGSHQVRTFQPPCRIRDNDGNVKAVVRILYREVMGVEFPYPLIRTHGCDYRCVNPFHIKIPDGFNEVDEEPTHEADEMDGLVSEIGNFIAKNGNNEDKVYERFLLDYTEDEIKIALGGLK